jgi:hypothetical protein
MRTWLDEFADELEIGEPDEGAIQRHMAQTGLTDRDQAIAELRQAAAFGAMAAQIGLGGGAS